MLVALLHEFFTRDRLTLCASQQYRPDRRLLFWRFDMTASTLGWMATALFAASYLFRQPSTLRKIQAAAACLWIIYGAAIGAMPVVITNVIVAIAALLSSSGRRSGWTEQWSARLNRQSGQQHGTAL
jgi:hypothetical protein